MTADPVLTCVEFAADGVTCTTTQWVQPAPSAFPPLTVQQGAQLGTAIMLGCVAVWASKLMGRGL